MADPASVLIVDDDEQVREVHTRALMRAGFRVESAGDGAAAIAAIERTPFDVVVSDLDMPQMNGIRLLERIRATNLDVPVIFVTGLPSIETAIQAVTLGALRYLTKPVSLSELVNVVTQAVRLHALATAKRQALQLAGSLHKFSGDQAGLLATFERALAGLYPVFQPIVSWSGRSVYAYETLLRSREPRMVAPPAILDAAERLGRMQEVSRAIRQAALAAASALPSGPYLFVNLDPTDLFDDELLEFAGPGTELSGRVVLEITERAALDGMKGIATRLALLRRQGFRIAIDDLGSGYSGLTSFTVLEPDVAKLDMALVRGIAHDPTRQTLVRTMVRMCEELKITAIVEGVETPEERDVLVDISCNLMQGYLFGRPAERFPVPRFDA